MPELMMSIFGLTEDSFAVGFLKWLEKCSIRFADQVLTVNVACKRIFSSRSCPPEKILVVMNSPDEEIFRFRAYTEQPNRNSERPFVIMYHGSIVERHGLDLAIQAVRSLKKTIPGLELRIYGARTKFLDSIVSTVENNGLRESVRYFGPKSLSQIAEAIEECDVGVIPNRRSRFTEINTPTRIFEYLSGGKPVVSPQVPGITDYFREQDLIFFRLGDAEDLARKIEFIYSHPQEAHEVVQRGQTIYLGHTWSQEKLRFVEQVRDLLIPRNSAALEEKSRRVVKENEPAR
jgi:glycosyltransferase involved in cell wall biosynthesis